MKVRGFSLLEMLMVLAIVGILAAFTWPAWQRHLVHTHRQDARMALLALAAGMEAWHLAAHTFDTTEPAPASNLPKPAAGDSAQGWYRLRISAQTREYYRLEARAMTAVASADRTCEVMTLDRYGVRNEETCWQDG